MKRLAALTLIFAIMAIVNISAQTWHLELTEVSQYAIGGELTVTNNTQTTIEMSFPGYPWATLLLDGEAPPFMYFPMMVDLTLMPGESHTEMAYYSYYGWIPFQLIPLGNHNVRGARMGTGSEPDWVGLGNYLPVTVYDTYHFIIFDLFPESISQDCLSFALNMVNTDNYPFIIYYNPNWLQLNINDLQLYFPQDYIAEYFIIPPGETFSQSLVYNPVAPIPEGTYDISIALQDYITLPVYEVPQTWTVTVGSVSVEDETNTPSVSFQLSAYPNPFAQCVNIILQSKSNAPVKAGVYNIKGQLIKTLDSSKALIWDGTDTNNQSVSNGIYFIQAEQDGRTVTSKVIRIK